MKTVTAPVLGAAAQRKLDQKLARESRKTAATKTAAKKVAKPAPPAKKAAKKAAAVVTPPAKARKNAKAPGLDMSNLAGRLALGFTAVRMAMDESKAAVAAPKAKKAAKPDAPKVIGRPEKFAWASIKPKHWQTLMDPEIAEIMGCTPPAVKNKRIKLMAEAAVNLKKDEVNPFACKRPKHSRTINVEAELVKRQKAGLIPATV